MELLKNRYIITLYENGKFCWVVEKRKKTIEDYEADTKIILGITVLCWVLLFLHWL